MFGVGDSGSVDVGADVFAGEGAADHVWFHHAEDADGHVVFHAKGEGGGVHDFELADEAVVEADTVVAFGVRIFVGVAVVDAIDFGGFEDALGIDLTGAEGGGGVGGEERVAGAGGEDDDAAEFEVAHGFAADERLGDIVHFDGALDAGGDVEGFEHALNGEGVHDGGEHAHVVGGGTFHAAVAGADATPEVAATDDDGDFEACLVGLFDLCGDVFDNRRRDVVGAARLPKGLATQF